MKKIKDTKLGMWLGNNAPEALAVVGEMLPDSGALGIVKKIVRNSTGLSPEKQIEGMQAIREIELEMEREMTKRTVSHHEVEKEQLRQEDLFTKRARPMRQYFWLVLILICYPLAYLLRGDIVDLPEILLIGIFVDFGLYTGFRSFEKFKVGKK